MMKKHRERGEWSFQQLDSSPTKKLQRAAHSAVHPAFQKLI